MAVEEVVVVMQSGVVDDKQCSPHEVVNWMYGILITGIITAAITILILSIQTELARANAVNCEDKSMLQDDKE